MEVCHEQSRHFFLPFSISFFFRTILIFLVMYSWYTISCSLSSIATWSTRTCISTFCFFWFYFHVSDYRECSRLPCTIQHVLTDYLLYEIKWFCVNPNLLISSSSFFFFLPACFLADFNSLSNRQNCELSLERCYISDSSYSTSET